MTLQMIPSQLTRFSNQWIAVATKSELNSRPLNRTLLGVPIVLFRHDSGITALLDRCPHRNVPLSAGAQINDKLRCSYHGWEFDSNGQCTNIPGLSECPQRISVPNFSVVENDKLIFVRLASGGADVSSANTASLLPEGALSPLNSQFDSFMWVNDLECNFVNGLENLLDPMHPAFVHSFLVRTSSVRNATNVEVKRTENSLEVLYRENKVASGFIPKFFEGMRTESIGRYYPRFTAQLEYRGVKGASFLLTTVFSPVDESHTRTFSWLSTPKGLVPAFIKEAIMRLIFAPVLIQDKQIVSAQSFNISRFKGEQFVSTRLDIVRPHILKFLNSVQGDPETSETPDVTPFESSLCIEI